MHSGIFFMVGCNCKHKSNSKWAAIVKFSTLFASFYNQAATIGRVVTIFSPWPWGCFKARRNILKLSLYLSMNAYSKRTVLCKKNIINI